MSNKLSYFPISHRENKVQIICLVIAVVYILFTCGFSSFFKITPDSNALFLLIGKMALLKSVFTFLGIASQLMLYYFLQRQFSLKRHWLRWLIIVEIVMRALSYIAILFMPDVTWDNMYLHTYVKGAISLLSALVLFVIGIVLVAKFTGRLRLYGMMVLITFVCELVTNYSLYYFYGSDSRIDFLMNLTNYCLTALIIMQVVCLKLTMKEANS